jgi:hypothetical protein
VGARNFVCTRRVNNHQPQVRRLVSPTVRDCDRGGWSLVGRLGRRCQEIAELQARMAAAAGTASCSHVSMQEFSATSIFFRRAVRAAARGCVGWFSRPGDHPPGAMALKNVPTIASPGLTQMLAAARSGGGAIDGERCGQAGRVRLALSECGPAILLSRENERSRRKRWRPRLRPDGVMRW